MRHFNVGSKRVMPKLLAPIPRHVLVREDAGGIGDVLTLSVALKQYRLLNNCKITVKCCGGDDGPRATLLRRCAGVDEVIVSNDFDPTLYDRIFDLTQTCAHGETQEVPNVKTCRAELYCRGLDVPLPHNFIPNVRIADSEWKEARKILNDLGVSPGYVSLAYYSSETYKDWGVDNWIRLRELLDEEGIQALAWGGELDERELGIMMVGALIGLAGCSVSVDTLFMHYAGAMGTPVVGLFGPSGAIPRTTMYPKSIGLQANLACSPCWRNANSPCQIHPDRLDVSWCMDEILPEEVLMAIKELVEVPQ